MPHYYGPCGPGLNNIDSGAVVSLPANNEAHYAEVVERQVLTVLYIL